MTILKRLYLNRVLNQVKELVIQRQDNSAGHWCGHEFNFIWEMEKWPVWLESELEAGDEARKIAKDRSFRTWGYGKNFAFYS